MTLAALVSIPVPREVFCGVIWSPLVTAYRIAPYAVHLSHKGFGGRRHDD
jgi:hypothetical protein